VTALKLLVSGGLGFIGSNFINHIHSKRREYKIINIDKMGVGANKENMKHITNSERYRFKKGDISNLSNLCEFLKNCDAVINFAAETHVDRSISNPKPFLDSNYIGTFNLLEAERKLGARIRHIQISTDEVYGDIIRGSYTEEDRLNPSNPYSATKAAADLLCQAYRRTYDLDVIVTRCTNNFGPYQFPEKLIPKTIIRALKDMNIPVYGTGENVRDWLYVIDHCEAIYHLIHNDIPGEVYNISAGNEISVLEIVKEILEILGKPEELISFVEDRPGHDLRYSLDSSKIRSALNWKPRHSFRDALRETVEWYVENEWWWKPLINEKVLHETPWKAPE